MPGLVQEDKDAGIQTEDTQIAVFYRMCLLLGEKGCFPSTSAAAERAGAAQHSTTLKEYQII